MTNKKPYLLLILVLILCSSCKNDKEKQVTKKESTPEKVSDFQKDLTFLKEKDSRLVTLGDPNHGPAVLVSPKYQGKVFTSSSGSKKGKSFGWVNYDAFEGKTDPHMNAYGGEDRLWLGPEGGPFSLFFEKGTEMVYENWHTPPAFDTEEWELSSSSSTKASLSKEMDLKNYEGTKFKLIIEREISLLKTSEIEKMLSIAITDSIKTVGFKTSNKLINKNDFDWNEETGAPVMWNLGMFSPSPKSVIILPYEESDGKVATTDYFGEIPDDRIKNEKEDQVLYLKADGKHRGKLGMTSQRTKGIAGSYAEDTEVLTITLFDVDSSKTYLNQEWKVNVDPFEGDAMNAYNDGPLEDGSQMGPFYEIESVSPAALIASEESIIHTHSVFHFEGDRKDLNDISKKVFGVSLDKISKVFN